MPHCLIEIKNDQTCRGLKLTSGHAPNVTMDVTWVSSPSPGPGHHQAPRQSEVQPGGVEIIET